MKSLALTVLLVSSVCFAQELPNLNCVDTVPGRSVEVQRLGKFDRFTSFYPARNQIYSYLIMGVENVKGKDVLSGALFIRFSAISDVLILDTSRKIRISEATVPSANGANTVIDIVEENEMTQFNLENGATAPLRPSGLQLLPGLICSNLKEYIQALKARNL